MSETVRLHQVLCVVPHQGLIRQQRVELPDINTRILFATPGACRDGALLRGQILCHIAGEDHLDLPTTMLARTRLRQPEHECPGPSIDFSRYLWGPAGTDEWR